MKDLVIIGGGGHCKSVIDVIESEAKYRIIGILDGGLDAGEKINGYEVLGDDSLIQELSKKGVSFHIAVGQIKNNDTRKRLYNILKESNAHLATIIASTAWVSKHARIGEGCAIMHNAFVNSSSEIGDNCIINTAAIIEHDVKIGSHCHLSTAVKVNGNCRVGDNCFIGSNAVLNHDVKIGDGSIVASSSLVNRNLNGGRVYAGCPVK